MLLINVMIGVLGVNASATARVIYQGGEMMMKSVLWWRKPEYPEETTDLRQVTDETFHTYGLCPVRGLNSGCSGVKQAVSYRGPLYMRPAFNQHQALHLVLAVIHGLSFGLRKLIWIQR